MSVTTFTPLSDPTSLTFTADDLVTPFRLSPAKEVLGVPITTLSYILLGVGGIAPILFIVIVIIVMKCYGWRRKHRYRRKHGSFGQYPYRGNVHRQPQDVWDVERRLYLQRHPHPDTLVVGQGSGSSELGSRNMLYVDDIDGIVEVDHQEAINEDYLQEGFYVPSPAHKAALNYSRQSPRFHSARVSNSNPNVYFMQTPVLQLHRNSNKLPSNVDKLPNHQHQQHRASAKRLLRKKKNEVKEKQELQNGKNYKRRGIHSASELNVEVQFDRFDNAENICESLPGIAGMSTLGSSSPPTPPPPPPPPANSASAAAPTFPRSMTSITSDEAEALHCFDTIYLEPLTLRAGGGLKEDGTPQHQQQQEQKEDPKKSSDPPILNSATNVPPSAAIAASNSASNPASNSASNSASNPARPAPPPQRESGSYAASTDYYDEQVQAVGIRWINGERRSLRDIGRSQQENGRGFKERRSLRERGQDDRIREESVEHEKFTRQNYSINGINSKGADNIGSNHLDSLSDSPTISDNNRNHDIYDTLATSSNDDEHHSPQKKHNGNHFDTNGGISNYSPPPSSQPMTSNTTVQYNGYNGAARINPGYISSSPSATEKFKHRSVVNNSVTDVITPPPPRPEPEQNGGRRHRYMKKNSSLTSLHREKMAISTAPNVDDSAKSWNRMTYTNNAFVGENG